jgi:hypothetical protein
METSADQGIAFQEGMGTYAEPVLKPQNIIGGEQQFKIPAAGIETGNSGVAGKIKRFLTQGAEASRIPGIP